MKLRDKLYFSFSILTPGFPHFYHMLGANLGLLLYEEVSVMQNCRKFLKLSNQTSCYIRKCFRMLFFALMLE